MHAEISTLQHSKQTSVLEAFQAQKAMARGLAESKRPNARLPLARAFCEAALRRYWVALCGTENCNWKIRPCPVASPISLDSSAAQLAAEIGENLAGLPSAPAGYLLGTLYTAMLPEDTRSRWGAYYTPPGLVDRLLEMAEQTGFDWSKGTAVDPACGGGAFLAPVALRMWQHSRGGSPEFILRNIASRLCGVEIDPFAGWMSQVLLEVALLPLCMKAGMRMPNITLIADALAASPGKSFDLVVGNPPYGRISLAPELRGRYARSLYGHANLYGVFTDLAIRLAKPGGIIAYVTPTSFLGGQYFKSLRGLLSREAPPCAMDFITDREGVFDDVLQETMLAVFRRAPAGCRRVAVHFLEPAGSTDAIQVDEIGRFDLGVSDAPWLLPRDRDQAEVLSRLLAMRKRLPDYGYSVSTGPLVWNRHKPQLRTRNSGRNVFPLVWAESVTLESEFSFSAEKRNHVPWIQVEDDQGFLVVREPCVLIQRTTSKEQDRRLIAAVMPPEFLATHGGAVVENHLNMARRIAPGPILPETICALLNSRATDRAYRCISGSVAVSAYELEALPLPDERQMLALQRLVTSGASREVIERAVQRMYGGGK